MGEECCKNNKTQESTVSEVQINHVLTSGYLAYNISTFQNLAKYTEFLLFVR